MNKTFIYLFRFFCSLKLAVFTLSALILLFATGTIYESFYGTLAVQEVIYHSTIMNVLLAGLALNIVAVMIDRYPWKTRHIPFLLAHIGILLVLLGAFITRFYGVDGYLRLQPEEQGSYVTTRRPLIQVFASFDGYRLSRLYRQKVFFFRSPPTTKTPYTVPLGRDNLKVVQFHPSAIGRQSYKPTKQGGPALRFHLQGIQGESVMWMFRPLYKKQTELAVGPARVVLVDSPDLFQKNTLPNPTTPSLWLADTKEGLKYYINGGKKHGAKGLLKKGMVLETGWMDFRFRLLEYWPKAQPKRVFTPLKRVSDQSGPAIQVEFKGQRGWLGLNSQLSFFDEQKVYIVAYGNEKTQLNFSLKLKSFKIQHYPSSRKAAHYESEVEVDGQKKALISMNQPLKKGAWTIYQSGFEEDKNGKPIASVFSINKDPGRGLKYLGSLCIVIGAIMLFKRRSRYRNRGKR